MNQPKTQVQMILEYIQDNPHLEHTSVSIADAIGLDRRRASKTIHDMVKRGVIDRNVVRRIIVPINDSFATRDDISKPNITSGTVELLDLFKNTDRINFYEACEILDMSPSELRGEILNVRARDGIEIAEIDGILVRGVTIREKIETLARKEIKFGVASDLHFGAKAAQITALHEFVKDCIDVGAKHIIVPGDVTDGTGIYAGQDLEQYASSAEAQLSSVYRNLPRGVQYIMLGGNHDHSWISRARGYNILASLESIRDDVTFIGFDRAIVPLLPGVDAMVWHGRGGGAYAKSYKLQNHVRNIAFDELRKLLTDNIPPTIRLLFAGHWHDFAEIEEGGIECFLCGAFAGRNTLTDRMGVTPVIRGLIIEIGFDDNGKLKRIRCDKMNYKEIDGDWKNYEHDPQEEKILKPIFS